MAIQNNFNYTEIIHPTLMNVESSTTNRLNLKRKISCLQDSQSSVNPTKKARKEIFTNPAWILSNDVSIEIFFKLKIVDIIPLNLTCRRFHQLILSQTFHNHLVTSNKISEFKNLPPFKVSSEIILNKLSISNLNIFMYKVEMKNIALSVTTAKVLSSLPLKEFFTNESDVTEEFSKALNESAPNIKIITDYEINNKELTISNANELISWQRIFHRRIELNGILLTKSIAQTLSRSPLEKLSLQRCLFSDEFSSNFHRNYFLKDVTINSTNFIKNYALAKFFVNIPHLRKLDLKYTSSYSDSKQPLLYVLKNCRNLTHITYTSTLPKEEIPYKESLRTAFPALKELKLCLSSESSQISFARQIDEIGPNKEIKIFFIYTIVSRGGIRPH